MAGGDDAPLAALFDNADRIAPRALRPYLPSSGPGRVLIASRNPHWQGVVGRAQTVAVDRFLPVEADAFLRARLGDEAAADGGAALAELLDYFPLALEQAAAYMATRHKSPAEYAELFVARREALWARAEPPDGYHATITTTWEIGFAHARQTAGAAPLLNLCCFLAPDGIPLWLLRELPNVDLTNINIPEAHQAPLTQLTTLLTDELALDDALLALTRYSLIERDGAELRLHRLVQTVARDRMGTARRRVWLETAVELVISQLGDFQNLHAWEEGELLLPHMVETADLAEAQVLESDRTGFLGNWLGYYLQFWGDYAGARPYYERALAIYEKVLGAEHPDTAQSLNNLGMLCFNEGNLAAAADYLRQALAIQEKFLGAEHPDTQTMRGNLAFVEEKLAGGS